MRQARDIIRALFPIATLVTPNIPEAVAILQMIGETSIASRIDTIEGMEQAAKAIYTLGPAYVLIKGGHLAPSNTTGQQLFCSAMSCFVLFIRTAISFSGRLVTHVAILNAHCLH